MTMHSHSTKYYSPRPNLATIAGLNRQLLCCSQTLRYFLLFWTNRITRNGDQYHADLLQAELGRLRYAHLL